MKRTAALIVCLLMILGLMVQYHPDTGFAKSDGTFDNIQLMAKKPKKNSTPTPTPEPTPTPAPVPSPVPEPAPTPAPSSVPQLAPAPGLTREIVGYYAEDWVGDTRSLQSVNTYGSKMAGIATFSFQLKADGTFNGYAPVTAVESAHRSGSKALALVHNFVSGTFNRDVIHAVLSDSALRAKAEANILSIIKTNGFDGVNIDFENIPSTDRAVFTLFVSELTKTLHNNGCLVTISVPAKTYDAATGWGGAFEYKALGTMVDAVMLMTYDEHWYGGSPGPVASIGWVEQVVKYAVSQIPVDKLLLGLGMYGYDWETAAGRTTRMLSTKQALQVANQYGASIKWDTTAQVPYFYYTANGVQHVIWFENNSSAAYKMNLVNQYNLAGLAFWRLGFEDDGFWQAIAGKFSTG